MSDTSTDLRDEIAQVLNRHSRENRSNTPDYLLAEFVLDALDAFDRVVRMREGWYGREVANPIAVADDVGPTPLHLVEPLAGDPPIPVDQLKFIADVADEEPPVEGLLTDWQHRLRPPDEDRTPERHFDWDENTTLGTALGEAIGLASMAWSERPRGVFNDELAGDIVNELLWFVIPPDSEGETRWRY